MKAVEVMTVESVYNGYRRKECKDDEKIEKTT